MNENQTPFESLFELSYDKLIATLEREYKTFSAYSPILVHVKGMHQESVRNAQTRVRWYWLALFISAIIVCVFFIRSINDISQESSMWIDLIIMISAIVLFVKFYQKFTRWGNEVRNRNKRAIECVNADFLAG